MRYELSGVRCVNDRRVLNGIFWVLRSGAPWRDLPEKLWAILELLQSLRALATGWHLGPDHGSHGSRPRWRLRVPRP